MNWLHLLFWICAASVVYVFAGYPLLLVAVCRFKKKPRRLAPFTGSISIVVAARNEEANLDRRLRELVTLLRASRCPGEILVVSDGSTDGTAAAARRIRTGGLVRVLERPGADGKAAALTAGCETCQGDVLIFADARQRWAPDALARLLENFADPRIGAVSGDLALEAAPGVMAGMGLYWRFEKWLRLKESQVHSQVGVTGAICGVRRGLFRPIPAGTLLDDVYWPLQVAMQGYRVVHDERARAFDCLPENPGDEFRRKVRTLAGNFQLLKRLPRALLPWCNPVWMQWLSHKLLRLAIPWALVGLFLASCMLDGWFYQALLWAQLAGYGLALAGLNKTLARQVPLAGAAASFLILNAAAFLAFWVWISGRAGRTWRKIGYPQEVVSGPRRRSRIGTKDEVQTARKGRLMAVEPRTQGT
jgi:glycosyltransferase involved in cell wall biosynthesis